MFGVFVWGLGTYLVYGAYRQLGWPRVGLPALNCPTLHGPAQTFRSEKTNWLKKEACPGYKLGYCWDRST